MPGDKFAHYLENINGQIDTLNQQPADALPQHQTLMQAAFEELRLALEELQVADAALRQQNEELIAARAAVELERERYQDLFEFAPDGYLVTDLNGKILEANCAAAALFNVSQKFLVGKPLAVFIPQSDRQTFRNNLLRLSYGDDLQEWMVQLRPREAVPFTAALTVTTSRCRRPRTPITLRWLVRDITSRNQAEEQVRKVQRQNLQLVKAAQLKSHFMATISHELRTPMNAIIGFSQLLLRQPRNQLEPSQITMVERILNNGKNLLSLINDILDLSKLEAGRLELRLESFNLEHLVKVTVEELHSLADEKQLQLEVYISLPNPQVVTDPLRLRQLLVNLLANAIKFTEVGQVSVTVDELSPTWLLISVQDTGIGIDPNDLDKIFEEFRQIDQSLTRKHGGTGLGLAITQALVRMMGGRISVESKLGQGSIFRVELPRQVAPLL